MLPTHVQGHNPPIPMLVKHTLTVEVLCLSDQTGIDEMVEAALDVCSLDQHGFKVTAVIGDDGDFGAS
jgi:hypothetical protein